jgi:hypothetical protein
MSFVFLQPAPIPPKQAAEKFVVLKTSIVPPATCFPCDFTGLEKVVALKGRNFSRAVTALTALRL